MLLLYKIDRGGGGDNILGHLTNNIFKIWLQVKSIVYERQELQIAD